MFRERHIQALEELDYWTANRDEIPPFALLEAVRRLRTLQTDGASWLQPALFSAAQALRDGLTAGTADPAAERRSRLRDAESLLNKIRPDPVRLGRLREAQERPWEAAEAYEHANRPKDVLRVDRQSEIDRLQTEIKALTDVERILGASVAPSSPSRSRRSSSANKAAAAAKSKPKPEKKRRPMTAAEKKAVSERMTAYWAERRRQAAKK